MRMVWLQQERRLKGTERQEKIEREEGRENETKDRTKSCPSSYLCCTPCDDFADSFHVGICGLSPVTLNYWSALQPGRVMQLVHLFHSHCCSKLCRIGTTQEETTAVVNVAKDVSLAQHAVTGSQSDMRVGPASCHRMAHVSSQQDSLSEMMETQSLLNTWRHGNSWRSAFF